MSKTEYGFDNEELEDLANIVKDAVLIALRDDGLLNEKQQRLTSKNYCVVCKKLSSISTIYNQIFKKKESSPRWIVTRVCRDYEPAIRKENEEA